MIDKKENPRLSISFDPELYDQIALVSKKENISMGELVRRGTKLYLTPQVTQENIDMIAAIIRDQLKIVIAPYMERSIALSAKSCIQSSTAAYLTAESIACFVPEHLQRDVLDTYEAARKKAIAYTKQPVATAVD